MSLSEKLITAAKHGSTREVRKLLGRGALFTKDQFGNTALHEAAWNGNNDIVKILLNSYCFVDSINNSGFTPLHLASQNGHLKVVKTLLKWKADPSLLNQHGETAIHLVAKYNHTNVISAFIAFKVNVNITGHDGDTPLHIAAKLGNIGTLKALLGAGANPTIANDLGMRPTDCAESSGSKEAIKMLYSAVLKMKPKNRSMTSISHNKTLGAVASSPSPSSSHYSTSPKAAVIGSEPSHLVTANGWSNGRARTPSSDVETQQPIRHRMQRAMSASAKLDMSVEDEPQRRKINKVKKNLNSAPKFKMSDSISSPTTYGFSASQETPIYVGGSDEYTFQVPRGLTPSSSSTSKNPSIDQLLNEIEREYNGPHYHMYQSHSQPCNDSPKTAFDKKGIAPYAEFNQLTGERNLLKTDGSPTKQSTQQGTVPSKAPLQANTSLDSTKTQDGRRSKDKYDYLESYDYLRLTPLQRSNSCSPQTSSSNFKASSSPLSGLESVTMLTMDPSGCPNKSGVKHRRIYEQLSPPDGDDGDTYVYMAPLKDLPEGATVNITTTTLSGTTEKESNSEISLRAENSSVSTENSLIQLPTSRSRSATIGNITIPTGKFSGKNKKAIIYGPQQEITVKKHEPNASREPPKGILSQPTDSEMEKSVLERYLQDELETMRQAFQIRLAQMERRYQKQLILEQQRNRQSPLLTSSPKRNPLSPQHSYIRRNSWHSCMTEEQDFDHLNPTEVRSGSSQGFDSDFSVEDSDVEMEFNQTAGKIRKKKSVQFTDGQGCPDLYEHDEIQLDNSNSIHSNKTSTSPEKRKEGLKGGDSFWRVGSTKNESPCMSPEIEEVGEYEESAELSKETKQLIKQKIQVYREKMGKYFQEKSEAQIATIEKHYLLHMDEVKRMYNERECEKVNQLECRIKDLENKLEVQTFV